MVSVEADNMAVRHALSFFHWNLRGVGQFTNKQGGSGAPNTNFRPKVEKYYINSKIYEVMIFD